MCFSFTVWRHLLLIDYMEICASHFLNIENVLCNDNMETCVLSDNMETLFFMLHVFLIDSLYTFASHLQYGDINFPLTILRYLLVIDNIEACHSHWQNRDICFSLTIYRHLLLIDNMEIFACH